MEFKKLSAPSLKELFINQLENMILSGKLEIGTQLPPERDLAESMGVSRAVVNAGITAVAAKGFLTIKPRVGTFVADYRRNGTMETLISIMKYNGGTLRKPEIKSIIEIRIVLDTLAVKLAMDRITKEEINMLDSLIRKLKKSADSIEASKAAYNFLHEFYVVSGNTLLPLICYSFKDPILGIWKRFCELHGIEALYKDLNGLLGYLKTRDLEGAIEHINSSLSESVNGKRQIYSD